MRARPLSVCWPLTTQLLLPISRVCGRLGDVMAQLLPLGVDECHVAVMMVWARRPPAPGIPNAAWPVIRRHFTPVEDIGKGRKRMKRPQGEVAAATARNRGAGLAT